MLTRLLTLQINTISARGIKKSQIKVEKSSEFKTKIIKQKENQYNPK
jgi:hypothetical protein